MERLDDPKGKRPEIPTSSALISINYGVYNFYKPRVGLRDLKNRSASGYATTLG